MMFRVVVSALCAMCLVGSAFAQERPGQRPQERPGTAQERGQQDSQFVAMAASGGLKEVQLGQIASTQGGSDQIKQFGRMMVEDHAKANKELAAIAAKAGFNVPARMNEKHQRVVERLSKLSGAQFDREFVRDSIQSHKEAIALFEQQSKNGTNAELKDWATKTLPTLKHHLEMAQKLGGDATPDGGNKEPREPKRP